jgi:hypothetical protein
MVASTPFHHDSFIIRGARRTKPEKLKTVRLLELGSK